MNKEIASNDNEWHGAALGESKVLLLSLFPKLDTTHLPQYYFFRIFTKFMPPLLFIKLC